MEETLLNTQKIDSIIIVYNRDNDNGIDHDVCGYDCDDDTRC